MQNLANANLYPYKFGKNISFMKLFTFRIVEVPPFSDDF